MLSNLLQELALARDHGQKSIVLDEARLNENPVSRLSRMIRHSFWSNLTRRIDGDGLEAICVDTKVSPNPSARLITTPRVLTCHLGICRTGASSKRRGSTCPSLRCRCANITSGSRPKSPTLA